MAARLRKKGIPFEILEKGQRIAEPWHHYYDRLHLHTHKYFSALPFRPFPAHYPQYVAKNDLISYWEDYAHTFAIQPHFGEAVQSIRRQNGLWEVWTGRKRWRTPQIVLATGYNRIPRVPDYPGLSQFEGEVLHSWDYKNGEAFRGKKVLVVGMGNTGAELALDLYEWGCKPEISLRSPVHIGGRDFLGHCVQWEVVALSYLPAIFRNTIDAWTLRQRQKDARKFGMPVPQMPTGEALQTYGKVPVVDTGTMDLIRKGKLKVRPGIQSLGPQQVYFEDGNQEAYEVILWATGYQPALGDFFPDMPELGKIPPFQLKLWYEDYPGLFFLGFSLNGTGILRGIYLDSAKIAQRIALP